MTDIVSIVRWECTRKNGIAHLNLQMSVVIYDEVSVSGIIFENALVKK
jgi:hypothetical protein